MAEDRREEVVKSIRRSLPEFVERNGAYLGEKQMDNLAQWVAGSIATGVYRSPCLTPPDIPCACIGTCQRWYDAKTPEDVI